MLLPVDYPSSPTSFSCSIGGSRCSSCYYFQLSVLRPEWTFSYASADFSNSSNSRPGAHSCSCPPSRGCRCVNFVDLQQHTCSAWLLVKNLHPEFLWMENLLCSTDDLHLSTKQVYQTKCSQCTHLLDQAPPQSLQSSTGQRPPKQAVLPI